MNVYEEFKHEGVTVQIVYDEEPHVNPLTDQDNAGTLYSWTRDFGGDERIAEPDLELLCPICNGEGNVPVRYEPDADWAECLRCSGDGVVEGTLAEWFEFHYGAALVIPLCFEDRRCDARIYENEDEPNCALVFTGKEIDDEWGGYVEVKNENNLGARSYAKGRVEELDNWLQGNVFGIRVLSPNGELLDDCWGFIGGPREADREEGWIRQEAYSMAQCAVELIERERREREYWMARGVVTV